MTKIYSPILLQKNNEYFIKYWTTEFGEPFGFLVSRETAYKNWEKSFKEVRIHPTQEKSFMDLAFKWKNRAFFIDKELEAGIELPPENIRISLACERCGYPNCIGDQYCYYESYAFLVEGKKETPEEETIILIDDDHFYKPDFNKFKKVFDESFSKRTPKEFVQEMENLGYVFESSPKQSNKDQEELWKDVFDISENFQTLRKTIEYLKTKFKITEI